MANSSTRIKLRLSITLSKDDLGLIRIYDELAAIERNASLSADEISEAKRRHLLGILYQYCYVPMTPFPGPLPKVSSISPLGINRPNVTEETPQVSKTADEIQVAAVPTTSAEKSALDDMNAASEKALSDIGVSFITANPNS